MTKLVQYTNGERRVVDVRECEPDTPGRMYFSEGQWFHPACASEFLHHTEDSAPLENYDLGHDMSEEEMAKVRDLDGVTIVRS